MKNVSLYLLLALFSSIVSLAPPVISGETQSGPDASASMPEGSSADGNYKIGKGDVLEINVWREPMLSGEIIVRNDGKISFTLLGDVQAADRTTSDLRDEIQERLKAFLGEPVVTVILRTAASQKFYVIGEIKTPGEFDLIKDMTVVQGIARAGGFTEWADKGNIILLRKEDGAEKKIRINYKDIIKGKNVSQNILLRTNDTIIVP
jgi:polysaccharide biosynthesis/export protein